MIQTRCPEEPTQVFDGQRILDGMPNASDAELYSHVLYSFTVQTLHSLRRRVLEGHSLEEAANFARYLQNARLDKVLSLHDATGGLVVDGRTVLRLAQELQHLAQETYERAGKEEWFPRHDETELEGINRRLDVLAAQVSSLTNALSRPNGQLRRSNQPERERQAL